MKLSQVNSRLLTAIIFSFLLLSITTHARNFAHHREGRAPLNQQTGAAATAQTPAANPADVASIDAILVALYDVISGPAGKERDWNRFRSLFIPGARLIPTRRQPTGEVEAHVLGVEEFVTAAGKNMAAQGFYERSIANHVEQFGQIAQVFSTYESRHKSDDKQPFVRGINSIQLMNDGKRWWVVTIFWQAEDAHAPIPKQYLKN